MPRCGQCHSQWATLLRCSHCEKKFPCPLQLLLVCIAVPVAILAALYLLFAFSNKLEAWHAVEEPQPAAKSGLTIEVDASTAP